METLRIIAQLIVGLGILNVWLVAKSKTPYRAGDASSMKEEFALWSAGAGNVVGLRGQGSRRSRSPDRDLLASTCVPVRNCSGDSYAGCHSDAYKGQGSRDQVIARVNSPNLISIPGSQFIALIANAAIRAMEIAKKATAGNDCGKGSPIL